MSALDRALAEFEGRLHQLRAWPDKLIIFEVTDFCAHSLHIASHLADILISRLIDVSPALLHACFFQFNH